MANTIPVPDPVGHAVPEPLPTETDDQYRERLRAWFDAVPTTTSPGFQRGSWEYICSLAGIAP